MLENLTEPSVCVDGNSNSIWQADGVPWWVAHTRPRCEKKLVEYCQRESCMVTLPCYNTAHKYRGKTVTFEKPLFPGYVFLRLHQPQRQKVFQSNHVANLLSVYEQDLFAAQLQNVFRALEANLEIRVAPEIGHGKRVCITRGPLRGMEGFVEDRYGMTTVLLRIDFIGQAAAVRMEAGDLELI